ncbi:MAG: hypothetical protein LBD42_05780 [Desulfovibrio sp.]|jgi:hypothetical protein|nr:hypothetical protein [Desulfovibrio sp.]
MTPLLRFLWWTAYVVVALILQQHIPGMDALTPGLLLSLQQKKTWQSFWLVLIFVLIQEGSGSLGFGSALLWYGGQIALFRLAEQLFMADSALFICMLSANLGVLRCLITWFMCIVQKVPMEYVPLVQESVVQAALIPVIWGIASLLYPKEVSRG